MANIKAFIDTLLIRFQTTVTYNDIGIEELELYHNEIDDYIVPMEYLSKLPNPLQLETISAIDDKGIEWILGVVQDVETGNTVYEVWIRDGERIESVMHE
jgi:hypothetical protein